MKRIHLELGPPGVLRAFHYDDEGALRKICEGYHGMPLSMWIRYQHEAWPQNVALTADWPIDVGQCKRLDSRIKRVLGQAPVADHHWPTGKNNG